MRTKLVITRNATTAPKESQVWPEGFPIEVSDRAKELAEIIKNEPYDRAHHMELAEEYRRHMMYRQGSEVLSAILQHDPFDAAVYCMRGKNQMVIRNYQQAAADLEMSARLTPDDWETQYHRGLVYYIIGDYAKSAAAFLHCRDLSANGGKLIAAANWCWLSLQRAGRKDVAQTVVNAISEDIDYGENYSYFKAVMLFSGRMSREQMLKVDDDDIPDITLSIAAFTVGNLYLSQGNAEEARRYLEICVNAAKDKMWSGFAYHAAMGELTRI